MRMTTKMKIVKSARNVSSKGVAGTYKVHILAFESLVVIAAVVNLFFKFMKYSLHAQAHHSLI